MINAFDNKIDPNKFRSTNQLWNQLRLNSPWSVGYISTLIEQKKFLCKEDWENFYYESGEKRLIKINNITNTDDIQKLKNSLFVYKYPQAIKIIPYSLKNLNFQYGRTKKELEEKGLILYNNIHYNRFELTLQDCIECVRFRTICETWNGIILREKNTIETLKKNLKNVVFKKVVGEFDHKYAVDYEIYKNNNLILGIQIKPPSYNSRSSFIMTAKKANYKKNLAYKNNFGANVLYVYSTSKGNIKNIDIVSKIIKIIDKF